MFPSTTVSYDMKIDVGEHGVIVPKDMLGSADAVEIHEENGRIVIEPISQAGDQGEDPALALGRDPVSCGVPDASENHDRHLYGE